MIIIQFLQDLLHDRLAEKDCLCTDAELFAVLIDGCHLAVVQVDNLTVTAYEGSFLLL